MLFYNEGNQFFCSTFPSNTGRLFLKGALLWEQWELICFLTRDASEVNFIITSPYLLCCSPPRFLSDISALRQAFTVGKYIENKELGG